MTNRLTRRDALKLGAAAGALSALPGCDMVWRNLGPQVDPIPDAISLEAGTQVDPIFHLLSRATYGPRPGDVERVRAQGANAWIEEQLLMGEIADAVLDAGGEVIGVLPQALGIKEIAHPDVEDIRIVGSMHERKALMEKLSDGFIAAPGGYGTLEELFEQLTWGQLGLHSKPCGLLNIAHYFDSLLAFLDSTTEQKFIRPQHREILLVAETAEDLIDQLEAYERPRVDKWLDFEPRDSN